MKYGRSRRSVYNYFAKVQHLAKNEPKLSVTKCACSLGFIKPELLQAYQPDTYCFVNQIDGK